jgi:hypothetical protein
VTATQRIFREVSHETAPLRLCRLRPRTQSSKKNPHFQHSGTCSCCGPKAPCTPVCIVFLCVCMASYICVCACVVPYTCAFVDVVIYSTPECVPAAAGKRLVHLFLYHENIVFLCVYGIRYMCVCLCGAIYMYVCMYVCICVCARVCVVSYTCALVDVGLINMYVYDKKTNAYSYIHTYIEKPPYLKETIHIHIIHIHIIHLTLPACTYCMYIHAYIHIHIRHVTCTKTVLSYGFCNICV